MRSQGFLFGIILWGNILLKRECRSNYVSCLFADKIITVVTIYDYVMYASGLKLNLVDRNTRWAGGGGGSKLLLSEWIFEHGGDEKMWCIFI